MVTFIKKHVKVFLSHRLQKEHSENALFQKYDVSYSEVRRYFKVCIEKTACRYYTKLSLVAYNLLPSEYHCHQVDFQNTC